MAADPTAGVSRVEWREELIRVWLGLFLISFGLVIVDVWSVLLAQLNQGNRAMIAFRYSAALLAL